MVLKEHYRLKSSSVILSRSFCNTAKYTDLAEVENIFKTGVSAIRKHEELCAVANDYEENHEAVCVAISKIIEK